MHIRAVVILLLATFAFAVPNRNKPNAPLVAAPEDIAPPPKEIHERLVGDLIKTKTHKIDWHAEHYRARGEDPGESEERQERGLHTSVLYPGEEI